MDNKLEDLLLLSPSPALRVLSYDTADADFSDDDYDDNLGKRSFDACASEGCRNTFDRDICRDTFEGRIGIETLEPTAHQLFDLDCERDLEVTYCTQENNEKNEAASCSGDSRDSLTSTFSPQSGQRAISLFDKEVCVADYSHAIVTTEAATVKKRSELWASHNRQALEDVKTALFEQRHTVSPVSVDENDASEIRASVPASSGLEPVLVERRHAARPIDENGASEIRAPATLSSGLEPVLVERRHTASPINENEHAPIIMPGCRSLLSPRQLLMELHKRLSSSLYSSGRVHPFRQDAPGAPSAAVRTAVGKKSSWPRSTPMSTATSSATIVPVASCSSNAPPGPWRTAPRTQRWINSHAPPTPHTAASHAAGSGS